MHSKQRLLLAAAVALVMLAAVAGPASAFIATMVPGGAISSASVGKLTFGSSPTIACNVTLNGSLNEEAFALRANESFGSIAEVRTANCSGGSVSGILNLPWDLSVNAMLGTVPNEVTGMLFNLVGVSFEVTILGVVNCLYSGTGAALLGVTATRTAGNYTTAGISVLPVELPFIRGSGACPDSGGFRGSFGLAPAQTFELNGIHLECHEEGGQKGFAFSGAAPLTPQEFRTVTCRYDWGTPNVRILRTAIVGAGAAAFSEGTAPSGTIRPGGEITVLMGFPATGSARNTPYTADYKIETDHGTIFLPMHGRTAP